MLGALPRRRRLNTDSRRREQAQAHAVVTPYHKEEERLLERCVRSVQAQTMPANHFLIADGHPQDWLDGEAVRHIKLDREHRDYGNTPRTIGALLAVSEGYDAIALLDADNWLEADHISTCIATSRLVENCDYVIARRNMCRPDGSVIDIEYDSSVLMDTNCFFLLPGAYHAIPHIGLTPTELSSICDRIFYSTLKAKNLHAKVAERNTVNYHCLWPAVYRKAGEEPPLNPRPNVDFDGMKAWLASRSPREREIINRRLGYNLTIRRGENLG